MSLSVEAVREALRGVMDPELHQDLVSLGMIGELALNDDVVKLRVDLTTPACPLKDKIEADVRAALEPLGIRELQLEFGAQVRTQSAQQTPLLPGIKNVVAVGAGKGGVGKSTVAVNLAASLARYGASVGLLDADLYGPSMPTMLRLSGPPQVTADKKLLPMEKHGMKVVTMGSFVAADQALVWRGPMLNNALRQFFADVRWGELDYLVIDLPPGTGDVPLSLAQMIPVGAALIVTTPQAVAIDDVRRAKSMFDQLKIPVAGLVENMAGYTPPGSDEVIALFGEGGGERAAQEFGVPFLGSLPIDPSVRICGDEGIPVVLEDEESPVSQALDAMAQGLAGRLSVLAAKGLSPAQPIQVDNSGKPGCAS